MEAINAIAKRFKLFVLEDAAEAHGAEVKNRKVGTWGTASVFSFFGNKILTTGEGGMVTTDDPELAQTLRLIRSQGQDPNRRYWFPVVGYNYRMTNIAAAIGLAQLEKVDAHLNSRRSIDHWYRKHLKGVDGMFFQTQMAWANPICWLFTIGFDQTWPARDELMAGLGRAGVETRPIFYPIHTLPPYKKEGQIFPVAEQVAASGMNLPTWHGLTEADVIYICQTLKNLRFAGRQAA